MARMKASMAAVLVLEKEGVAQAFGVPGAAINPFYAALRERGTIAHVLARHVEAPSHMAEGYTRARAGGIQARDHVGARGARGADAHADVARRGAGETLGHMAGGLDVAGKHMLDAAVCAHRRVERVDRRSR